MTLSDCVQDGGLPLWRVLVVENDPKQRADQVACLVGWGYGVFVAEAQLEAEDVYQSLRTAAFQKARDYHCHIVLVDQRLESDISRTDNSGLRLAEELTAALPPLHAIVLSGYAKAPIWTSSRSFCRYVGKEAGPEALKLAIEETITQIQTQMLGSGLNDRTLQERLS